MTISIDGRPVRTTMSASSRPVQKATPNFSRKPVKAANSIKRKPVPIDRRSLSSDLSSRPLLGSQGTPESSRSASSNHSIWSPLETHVEQYHLRRPSTPAGVRSRHETILPASEFPAEQVDSARGSTSSENLKPEPLDIPGKKSSRRTSTSILVSNFAPLTCAEQRPTVLRSYSGEHWMSSGEVVSRFKRLVETQQFRVEKSTLNSLLGVDPTSEEALLKPLEPQLYLNRDGSYIITWPELEAIADTLKVEALRSPVDLRAFAVQYDIAWDSLQKMIEAYAGKDWPRVILDVDDWSFLVSHTQVEILKARLSTAMTAAGSEICQLNAAVSPDIPSPVIIALATEASLGAQSEIRYVGDQVVYIPPGYSAEEFDLATQRASSAFDQLQRETLIAILARELWCPLHLYTAGIDAIHDEILRARQKEFVKDHFRREEIPRTIAIIHDQNLAQNATVADAIDRLHCSSANIETFANLQGVVLRLGNDLAIAAPNETLVFETKHRHIVQTVQAMQTMPQGLDILRNLVWILLATREPGLFMSSVKDTTRLIHMYGEVGDPEVMGLLNLWLTKLNGGIDDPGDVRQMKHLASAAVEEWMEARDVVTW
ncbi:hypothetical protein DOTSEDRAFT_33799 [Dothistroma septosporum NZE10]|uniref:Uncharacterized protein n=1 Tax=Dothistroma septosporum (strain NZE10 / CBS 128990) TaxID=675120 RepID=N1PPA3_DOTSN|nr:hypothetical protein DOTSEDRAFT_33799 [Dothistroma septosporum NZE10]